MSKNESKPFIQLAKHDDGDLVFVALQHIEAVEQIVQEGGCDYCRIVMASGAAVCVREPVGVVLDRMEEAQ